MPKMLLYRVCKHCVILYYVSDQMKQMYYFEEANPNIKKMSFVDYDENDYMNKILKIIKTPDTYDFFSKNSIEKSKKFTFNYFSNSLERLLKIWKF